MQDVKFSIVADRFHINLGIIPSKSKWKQNIHKKV